ncbi:MAG: hypothetical protein JOZ48_04905 [Acidobacteriaceae bacterium]|nr:hypothetical protein [Acidobacteriaceae bacterium]
MSALDPETQPLWSPIGPFSIPHGQPLGGAVRPAVSARLSCIAVDPTEADHILIGCGGGGIWETRNAGISWHPAESEKGELPCAIGAIAFLPGQSDIVYAGTGEGNDLRDFGLGVWRSTNGGRTWSEFATEPFIGLGFFALMIDAGSPKHMLAATTGGVFYTTDNEADWKCHPTNPGFCWDLSMNPQSANEVFAATPRGLLQSKDGGKTWPASVLLDGAPETFQRLAVCHAPSDPDFVYVFGHNNQQPPAPALWRRSATDGAFESIVCPKVDLGQIVYDWYVAVSPENRDVVYLGEKTIWKGARKADDTWAWKDIATGPCGDAIHSDQHAIAFHPTSAQVIYAGNDGGIFRTNDSGGHWESLNKGLCITQFEYLTHHPDYDAWLMGGTQDNGTLRYRGSEVWYQVAEGDGGECATNEAFPYTVYHCYFNIDLERSTTGGDWGSWTSIFKPDLRKGYRTLWYPPMEVFGNVVVMAGETVFVSTDIGTTFQRLPLPADADIATAIWIAGPFQFLIGTQSGDLFQFDWFGTGWAQPAKLTQPRSGNISSIRGDRKKARCLWVTYSDALGPTVYRFKDPGTGWEPCMNGLPQVAANIVELDPESDTIFAGTDAGVWRSRNASEKCEWTVFSNGLANAIVGDLLLHNATRVLRAGTRSRGVWEVDLKEPPDTRATQIYLRHSAIDTGRRYPSLEGMPDPFVPNGIANWWESPDILIDSEPYWSSMPASVDFVAFEENGGNFPNAHGRTRIFVQVHQRGPKPAGNVVVQLLSAAAVDSAIPDLTAGFWDKIPLNHVPAGSPWSMIGSAVTVSGLQTGHPEVAAFEWEVPKNASGDVWLLATITADNDKRTTAELNITKLVRGEGKCALKRVKIAN